MDDAQRGLQVVTTVLTQEKRLPIGDWHVLPIYEVSLAIFMMFSQKRCCYDGAIFKQFWGSPIGCVTYIYIYIYIHRCCGTWALLFVMHVDSVLKEHICMHPCMLLLLGALVNCHVRAIVDVRAIVFFFAEIVRTLFQRASKPYLS